MPTLTAHTESTRGQIGQGIYSLAELHRYLTFYAGGDDSVRTLRWLSYGLNPVAHKPRQPDYSFSDLVSLFVVRELRAQKVTLWRIKEAEATMRKRLRQERPFLWRHIFTDGDEVYFRTESGQLESANASKKRRDGQQMSHTALEPYLQSIEYHDHLAVAWRPAARVELNPQIQFGEPVIAGTRVPTAVMVEVADAAGLEVAARRLGVAVADARAAVDFEAALAAV